MNSTADPEELEAIDRTIAGFDGRHVAPLEHLAKGLKPSDAILGALIDKLRSSDESGPTAASWILKSLLERGARPLPGTLDRLISAMSQMEGWEARLHMAQSFHWLEPSQSQALTAARTLRHWFDSDSKFVRAWACDALWRLGAHHPRLEAEARRVAALAETDSAASVRARARNLPGRP